MARAFKTGITAEGHIEASENLKSNYSSGDEGGEIFLNKPVTNTTLNTGVTIDVNGDKVRIFENGGTNRGVYIALNDAATSVGTNLLGSATDTNYYPSAIVFNAGTTAGPTLDLTMSGSGAPDLTAVAIPSAGASASGVVTTDTQTFAGTKTFSSTITGSINGNAGTATTLATARNINGVSFNGSADITVTAAAGTLTGTTLNSGVTASSLTSVGTLANLTVTNTITGSVSGSAATLTTTRTIWGQNFNGSANVTGNLTSVGNITAAAATSMTIKTADNGSSNTSNLTISTGNATGTSGNITVDVGTGTASTGSVSIGTTSASSIVLGRTGLTTTTDGAFTAVQTVTGGNLTTGGSLTRTSLVGGGTTGASINTSGQFIRTTSSARYKQDITDAAYSYEDVLALSPKTFRLKDEAEIDPQSKVYGGLIAEDVHEIESLRVFVNYKTEEDGSVIPDGIAYGEMVSALISALKHQDARIEALEAQVQALSNQI